MKRAVLLLAAVFTAAAGTAQTDRSAQTPVFTGSAELTVLNVVVMNRKGAYVTDLTQQAFTVYEDGAAQPIELFVSEDAPATIGLLVDDSASMYAMRDLVGAAAGAFAATSNSNDEIFALTFNDFVRAVLPPGQEFTTDPALLERALRTSMRTHGRTALHDAVADGMAHLDRGHQLRKVLVIVSDGADNASTATFDQVAHAAATANTVIYGIAIVDPTIAEGRPDRLKALAELTGGTAQVPRNNRAVRLALENTARDIRSSYIVGYVPPPARTGRHRVHVTVRAQNGEALDARTRREYVRSEE